MTSAVLVSWVSVNGHAGPLLTAMTDANSPFRGRIENLYLCTRAPGDEREREALAATRDALAKNPVASAAKLEVRRWKTRHAPTEHEPIREFAEQTLLEVRRRHPHEHIVIHLSPGTPTMHAIWLLLGSTGFIAGPLSLIQTADERARKAGRPAVEIVDIAVDSWLRRYRQMRVDRDDGLDDGQLFDPARVRSPALRDALGKLERWAVSPAPVLLLGERGSGKTTLAAWLRARSPFSRADLDPWPVVVCGQFQANPQLAQSELFGHAKGAFTGASEDRVGLLEQVDGDSLFLDEICDIDRATQRSLMAVVEGRGFRRLGHNQLRHSKFRLICATNRPLEQLRGAVLDEDFLDRVAVFILRIPALRECREDVPDAWARVLSRVTARVGLGESDTHEFASDRLVLDRLSEHPLPGNFRDLERAAHHLVAAVLAGATREHRIRALRDGLGPADAGTLGRLDLVGLHAQLPLEDGGYEARVDAYRRAWLLAALEHAHDNKSRAAEALGMSASTFKSQLDKLRERAGSES
jgi:DNA-binding NtrC family response regulator